MLRRFLLVQTYAPAADTRPTDCFVMQFRSDAASGFVLASLALACPAAAAGVPGILGGSAVIGSFWLACFGVLVQCGYSRRQRQRVGYVEIANTKAVDRKLTDLERLESRSADNEPANSQTADGQSANCERP
jgi:hypothetical protein